MRINDKNFLDFLSILNSLGYKICYIFNGITNTEFVFVLLLLSFTSCKFLISFAWQMGKKLFFKKETILSLF